MMADNFVRALTRNPEHPSAKSIIFHCECIRVRGVYRIRSGVANGPEDTNRWNGLDVALVPMGAQERERQVR